VKVFGWAAAHDGCEYYRLRLPLDQLQAAGHETMVSRRIPPGMFTEFDIIIAQRMVGEKQANLLRWIRERSNTKIVYELDDDLLNTDPSIGPPHDFFSQPDVKRRMIKNIADADLVTVSTEPLAEVMRQYNENVAVLPNCIDERIFARPPAIRDDGRFVIGWEGSSSHGLDWTAARDGVARFLKGNPDAWMWFIGNAHPVGLPSAQTIGAPWLPIDRLPEHYYRVKRIDIGLAPLWRSKFNASKSHIRALMYCALGVPAIYSNEPPYRSFIEHGTTGFLAKGEHEWLRYLRILANDPELRTSMGEHGRVEATRWTAQGNAYRWETAYAKLLGLPVTEATTATPRPTTGV
jgi:glycosyltransferase involved in cell wall biosynthesis